MGKKRTKIEFRYIKYVHTYISYTLRSFFEEIRYFTLIWAKIAKKYQMPGLMAGLSQAGGSQAPPPQFFADQLTLSQPGRQIMPTTVLRAPLNFKTALL